MRLSSSRRRADSPYSAVYRVRVCSCVRHQPQSFIKGSTLKGQLNYSFLTGGGGVTEEMVGMAMLLLSDALLHPGPPLRASFRDESPSLFLKLINKIRLYLFFLCVGGFTANDGTFVC